MTKTGAIACFLAAAVGAIAAVGNIIDGANRPDQIEDLVGYAVGSFLVPIGLLIAGLIL